MRTRASVRLLHCDLPARHLSKPLQTEISGTITAQERSGCAAPLLFLHLLTLQTCELKVQTAKTSLPSTRRPLEEPLVPHRPGLSFITENPQIPRLILKRAEKIDKHLPDQKPNMTKCRISVSTSVSAPAQPVSDGED